MREEAITRRGILPEAPLLAEDWREVSKRRGDHKRLGFAYHLIYLGFNSYWPNKKYTDPNLPGSL